MDVSSTTEDARCPVDQPVGRSRSVIPASALPAPKEPGLLQTWRFIKYQTDWLEQVRERCGHRFRISLKPGPDMWVLSDPDEVKAMFMAPLDVLHTSTGNQVANKFFGTTGLALVDEEEHVVRRKALMPSFKGTAYQRVEAAITDMAAQEIPTWPHDRVVSLHPIIHRFTMRVIREVIFGEVTPSCWDELLEELMGVVYINNQWATYLMFDELPDSVMWLLKKIKRTGIGTFLEHSARADELLAQAVKERLELGEFGDDMLSMMLGIRNDDGSMLSGTELRDEIMTLFLAGTETTVSSLCWAMEYLSRDADLVARMRARIDSDDGDAYLTAAAYEVLRLRPPLPNIMPREVMKPIEIGGVLYEPGAVLWASAHLVGNDQSHYDDPKAFRPERFLGTKPDPLTFIPFGGGITRCLGDRIAIHEIKTVLREVLNAYDLHRSDPTPERVHHHGVLVIPEYGARVELRPRAMAPSP